MAFFTSAVGVLKTLVIALGAGLGIWGVVNLMEGYGNDNPGAKANVIFFENRPGSDKTQTKEVWIYDYRTGIHHTLKQHPLKEEDLADFVECYKPGNIQDREETYDEETHPNGRWRRFAIDDLLNRDKTSLDITWIQTGEDISQVSLDYLLSSLREKSEVISEAVSQLEELLGDIED